MSVSTPTSRLVLLSAGSNAENQLSHSGTEDSHRFLLCELASSDDQSSRSTFPPPGTTAVVDLSFGANHTVALLQRKSGSQVWATGDSRTGQLGDPSDDHCTGFRPLRLPSVPSQLLPRRWKPTKIACSWTTTFVAFESDEDGPGLLLAMGTNDFGELANGQRGVGGGYHRWHVFEDERVVELKAGPRHVVIVVEERGGGRKRVLGWGAARHGQLSSVPLRTLGPTGQGIVAVEGSASASASDPTSSRPAVQLVPTVLDLPGSSPTQLALGLAHTLLLSRDPTSTTLRILGRPNNPATDLSLPPSSPIEHIASTWSASLVLSAQDLRVFPKTGPPKTFALPDGEAELRAGSEHILVMLDKEDKREIWGWGWNEHGNMGDGTTDDWKGEEMKRVWNGEGEAGVGGRVVDCWAGNGTSWVLVER